MKIFPIVYLCLPQPQRRWSINTPTLACSLVRILTLRWFDRRRKGAAVLPDPPGRAIENKPPPPLLSLEGDDSTADLCLCLSIVELAEVIWRERLDFCSPLAAKPLSEPFPGKNSDGFDTLFGKSGPSLSHLWFVLFRFYTLAWTPVKFPLFGFCGFGAFLLGLSSGLRI